MDFKFFNEFRKYGRIADFFKSGENVTSNIMCMLLNGRELKEENKDGK